MACDTVYRATERALYLASQLSYGVLCFTAHNGTALHSSVGMQCTCLEVQSLFEVTRTTYMYYIIVVHGGCMLEQLHHVLNSAVALCAKLSTFGTDLDIFPQVLDSPVPAVLSFAVVVCICIHALSYESCFLKQQGVFC